MPELDKHDSPLPTTTVKWRFPSVHPEGRKYVVGAAAITFFAFLLHVYVLEWVLVGLTIWIATFFRDPVRTTPHDRTSGHCARRRPHHDDREGRSRRPKSAARMGWRTANTRGYRFS